MRISDWSSDVCSSDLICQWRRLPAAREIRAALRPERNCAISQSSVESFGRRPVGMNKGHRLEECAHLIVGSQPGSCAFNLLGSFRCFFRQCRGARIDAERAQPRSLPAQAEYADSGQTHPHATRGENYIKQTTDT